MKYGRLENIEANAFLWLGDTSESKIPVPKNVVEALGVQALDWHEGEQLRYGETKRSNLRLFKLRITGLHTLN